MKCGEYVRLIFFLLTGNLVSDFSVGNYVSSPYIHTVFPRSDHVFSLGTLDWQIMRYELPELSDVNLSISNS